MVLNYLLFAQGVEQAVGKAAMPWKLGNTVLLHHTEVRVAIIDCCC